MTMRPLHRALRTGPQASLNCRCLLYLQLSEAAQHLHPWARQALPLLDQAARQHQLWGLRVLPWPITDRAAAALTQSWMHPCVQAC